MKKIVKFPKIMAIVAIIFIYCGTGCSTNDGVLSSDKGIEIDFELIGYEHNKGLDHVYNYLKKCQENNNEMLLKSAKIYNIYDVVENASVLFVMESDYGYGLEKDNLLAITNLTTQRQSLRSVEVATENLINIGINELQTKKQQYYLKKFNDILFSAKTTAKSKKGSKKIDIEDIISQLNKLDLEIISKCTSNEAIPLLSTTSVCRHSLQYWNANLYNWVTLLNEDVIHSSLIPILKSGIELDYDEWDWFSDTLISMGQSDAIGAGIGAAVGFFATGVGAAPGAVAGACNASAGAAIKSVLQRWGVF